MCLVFKILLFRREARATRLKYSPTSIKLRFAKYLADDLCHQGIVAGRAAAIDCSCCRGSYRADLPGVVKWRLVTPCGHWCCGAAARARSISCRRRRARSGRSCVPTAGRPSSRAIRKEWPGQVIVS